MYKSDVVIVLSKEATEELKSEIDRLEESLKQRVTKFFNKAVKYKEDNEGNKYWCFKDVDWTSSFNNNVYELRFIEWFLDVTEQEDYLFIRIGECYDDIECLGYFRNKFKIKINRNIEVEGEIL